MYKVVDFDDVNGVAGGGLGIVREEWLTPVNKNPIGLRAN